MYAVVFRAEINSLDENYSLAAKRMRELAMQQYGCTEFTAVTEGKQEIAISYWNTLDATQTWKQNAEHLIAQELGQSVWYQSYQVQIVEILREYQFPLFDQ